jgi:Dyp-type peroxidase family
MPPFLEVNDIQGNILAGFNTNVEVFVGLTANRDRTREAASWLVDRAPEVSTVVDVREQRRQIKPLALDGLGRPLAWTCLGIGSDFIQAIREDFFAYDEAFLLGLINRAPLLGDLTNPSGWTVGKPEAPLDVLLIIASNDEAAASKRADELIVSAAAAGLSCTYQEVARRLADREHFGFRDGISQPQVRDFDVGGDIGAGHFVFGYERAAGTGAYYPTGDPNGFLKNGSFMVFRRLAQDVAAFESFCASEAAALSTKWPSLNQEQLAALLVGRWPSGAVADISMNSDPGTQANENGFDFANDIAGAGCPFGAHIRKVNPRLGPRDVVDVPRILRRGIPFGPEFARDAHAERGLAFVSFQTSIRDQFEFLTTSWMNDDSRPSGGAGHDLLVGRSIGQRAMPINCSHGPVTVADGGMQWITPTGGGYLFAPSRTALQRLLDPLVAGSAWRVEKQKVLSQLV